MIYGIGIDCVTVSRIEKSIQSAHFFASVFSPQEQAFLQGLQGKKKGESAAACFAAKESFLKATGHGLGSFSLGDIAALRKDSGAPYYEIKGKAADFLRENQLRAHLSITHENGLAMAYTILEQM